MKTSVLDFIDSKTLRQHLSGQTLAPAVECILIAQSRCRSLNDKLAALQERYDKYSTEDFKKGVYNSWADDFKKALKEYILIKSARSAEAKKNNDNEVYLIGICDSEIDNTIYRTYKSALEVTKTKLASDDTGYIKKCSIDSDTDNSILMRFNDDHEVYDVEQRPIDEALFDKEYCIEGAYAELPHRFNVGDIVRHDEIYSVVADVKHYDSLPNYMKHSDYTDMCLYCLGYYKDQLHSCNGAFGHSHFPILQTELCPEEELPESKKELIILSRLLKGEIRLADFLEMYSNGDIDSLMKIKGLIK